MLYDVLCIIALVTASLTFIGLVITICVMQNRYKSRLRAIEQNSGNSYLVHNKKEVLMRIFSNDELYKRAQQYACKHQNMVCTGYKYGDYYDCVCLDCKKERSMSLNEIPNTLKKQMVSQNILTKEQAFPE